MNQTVTCIFDKRVPMDDVEGTLALALVSTQALHGETRTRLEIKHRFSRKRRTCDIDVTSETGTTFVTIFVGLLTREFGEKAFQIKRRSRNAPESSWGFRPEGLIPVPLTAGVAQGTSPTHDEFCAGLHEE